MPYKSDQHAQNLRHVGFIAGYWTVAFIIKYSTTFIDAISPDNIGRAVTPSDAAGDDEGKQIFYAICYFGLSVICDILPFILALDSQFIKIVTFDMIFQFERQQHDNNDMENQLALQGQQQQLSYQQNREDLELQEEIDALANASNGGREGSFSLDSS